uniref:Uncharacterized protein n=1 Tax=Arundo donax TaxID=35708 RepID=A0A0A9CSI2_ARUDO
MPSAQIIFMRILQSP